MRTPIMKTLDVYIIKKFLGTYFFAIALIISISIIFDLSEKIDNYIENEAPAKAVFKYYLNFIPYFTNLLSSLFAFIAVIFFTSKMATHSAIIAILSNGVSFNRLLRPYIICAFLIAAASLVLRLYIIPPANEDRLHFDSKYLHNVDMRSGDHIHKQISPGVYIYVKNYRAKADVGYDVTLEKFEDGKLQSKLSARLFKYDSLKDKWTFQRYHIRTIKDDSEIIQKGNRIDSSLTVTPADFETPSKMVETYTIGELNDFIEKARLQGSERIDYYLFEKQSRFAYPFSMFILTIIGMTLSCRKVRGGTSLFMGLGLGLSFTYILFMRFAKMFAIGGIMSASMAAWVPNIVYGIIAYILYRSVPK